MYVPQGIKKPGPARRFLTWLEHACRDIAAVRAPKRRRGRRGAVARQRQSWQLKKFGRNLACLLLLTGVVGSGCWLAVTLMSGSNLFAVTSLTVEGNRMASTQQILDKGGLARGMSLLALDCRGAEGQILGHPWVEEATVERQWPDGVLVRVRERQPLALVNLEREGRRQLYYLDGKGEVFAPTTPSRDLDFPVLSGQVEISADGTQKIEQESLAGLALDFLQLAAQGNQVLPSQGISEVHLHPERGLVVYLVDYPFPIYMGKEKVRTRFNLLVRVLAQLYRQDKVKEVAEIRMDYAEDKILVANIGT